MVFAAKLRMFMFKRIAIAIYLNILKISPVLSDIKGK